MDRINPFRPNYPTEPTYFVGRKKEIELFKESINQGILSNKTDSLSILGLWGIGKTSLLLKFKELSQSNYQEVIPITMSVTTDLTDFKVFVQNLLDTFQVQLSTYKKFSEALRGEIAKWTLKSMSLAGFELKHEEEKPFLASGSALLIHKLKEAWNIFLKKQGIKNVIFFLDDLHNLHDEKVLQTLRDIFQNLVMEGYNYSLIFTAREGFFGEIREIAEPATRFFTKVNLKLFTEEETEDFLNETLKKAKLPVKFDKDVVSHACRLTLGHPYFLSFVGKYSLKYFEKGVISKKMFIKLWPLIFKHIAEEKFKKDLEKLNENEKKLLILIAQCEKDIISHKDIKEKIHTQYYTSLLNKNLIERIGWGEYKLYHPLFKEFLKHTN